MITHEERLKVYTNALVAYGEEKQCIVAIEELSGVRRKSARFCGAMAQACAAEVWQRCRTSCNGRA